MEPLDSQDLILAQLELNPLINSICFLLLILDANHLLEIPLIL